MKFSYKFLINNTNALFQFGENANYFYFSIYTTANFNNKIILTIPQSHALYEIFEKVLTDIQYIELISDGDVTEKIAFAVHEKSIDVIFFGSKFFTNQTVEITNLGRIQDTRISKLITKIENDKNKSDLTHKANNSKNIISEFKINLHNQLINLEKTQCERDK